MDNNINPELFNAVFEPYITAIVEKEVSEQMKHLREELGDIKKVEKPLTVKALAAILGLSTSYIYTLCSKEGIPHKKKCSRVFFYLSEINVWLKSQ